MFKNTQGVLTIIENLYKKIFELREAPLLCNKLQANTEMWMIRVAGG